MAEIRGVVTGVQEPVNGGSGNKTWTRRSIAIDSKWYGGFANEETEPAIFEVNEGDVVVADVITNGKYDNFTRLEVAKKAQQPKKVQNSTTAEVKDNYHVRMAWAGARNAAIETVTLLLQQGAITLKDSNGKAVNKATKKQAIDALIETYTHKYLEENWYAEAPEDPSDTVEDHYDNEEEDFAE